MGSRRTVTRKRRKMVYTYLFSDWSRHFINNPLLRQVYILGAILVVFNAKISAKFENERRIYFMTNEKWASRRLHTVYNWQRDPLKTTMTKQHIGAIKRRNIDIEQILRVKLPQNTY
eukprot:NODE_2747_length_475_cov_359.978873_g2164_i0.p1 GENE.NODE_2747_length_475_cov_359.978873_g2164_i0~~NODE_2747_length_475_cov_359.978873_g2164_i0.p1  ORF type:complete len:117 (+),score=24.28 NODE_2747_length_475_cov_359.978873_g2164_i0:55-405(+)